eukprot:maker-scaffold540_size141973-snap-gene-0.22 protein:Tk04352 transcript:maker-scaffold540_size141973-snap-gene-0.22-mRNA-1 annotation:"unknown"
MVPSGIGGAKHWNHTQGSRTGVGDQVAFQRHVVLKWWYKDPLGWWKSSRQMNLGSTQILFPSNVATRSTRSEAAGVGSPHLPYAANTLVDNGIAMWNKFPDLREASTKRMASNIQCEVTNTIHGQKGRGHVEQTMILAEVVCSTREIIRGPFDSHPLAGSEEVIQLLIGTERRSQRVNQL